MSNIDFKKLTSHCKEYGFIFQSSEVYDGLAAVYDYGPNGSELKRNIEQYWWKSMVQMHDNIVGIDASIFMHPKVWKASGHVDAFNDPLIDNKDSKKRYRADQLIEGYCEKIEAKIKKDVVKAAKRFGDAFDEKQFRETNQRIIDRQKKIDDILGKMNSLLKNEDMEGLKVLIEDLEIACPESGSKNWTEVRQFNLMFSTQLGNIAGEEGKLYLRPETAQGIFVNFLNVQKTARQKIPFGIAQIGKAFRNEIIARQFTFRMREFHQMEMQFFVRPGEDAKWYDYWKNTRLEWHKAIGSPAEKLRYHDHDNLAHYANAALDIQFEFPFGFRELEGIHSRTDFDLKSHQELSGRKLQYFDPELNENYVPYVIETSIGLDRMILSQMTNALTEEDVPDAEGKASQRTVLKLHPSLSPQKCAVLPLLKNHEGLVNMGKDVFNNMKKSFNTVYEEKDAIGRRYRRQDAIGTPFCLTIDHQSLEDNTVTVRNRDDLSQKRVSIEEAKKEIESNISYPL